MVRTRRLVVAEGSRGAFWFAPGSGVGLSDERFAACVVSLCWWLRRLGVGGRDE